jgi:lipopolysaccharide transport system ATP-binding protein
MYVRLGFAVAAHLECEIMIADEVLAVGDVKFQQKAIGKMSDLSQNGRTVIFVSHNTGAVANLCNKGLIIEHGKMILNQCPVADAIAEYNKLIGAV